MWHWQSLLLRQQMITTMDQDQLLVLMMCGDHITKRSHALQCDKCEIWQHLKCDSGNYIIPVHDN